jgi:hypothetical protein
MVKPKIDSIKKKDRFLSWHHGNKEGFKVMVEVLDRWHEYVEWGTDYFVTDLDQDEVEDVFVFLLFWDFYSRHQSMGAFRFVATKDVRFRVRKLCALYGKVRKDEPKINT